VRHSTLS